MSEALAFDYMRAARDAGWHMIETGYWVNPLAHGAYDGTVRQLCFFLGIGPEWDEKRMREVNWWGGRDRNRKL